MSPHDEDDDQPSSTTMHCATHGDVTLTRGEALGQLFTKKGGTFRCPHCGVNMTRIPEYEEGTCITAQELRVLGVTLPANIPDVAWVPRDSMRYGTGADVGLDKEDASVVHVSLSVTFLEPFRWVTATFTLPRAGVSR